MKNLVNFKDGIVFHGNTERIQSVMKRAAAGEAVMIGFLGGSITQGSLASAPDTCYAANVARWWREQYPEAEIAYVNAGIGGTTSQFGVARAEKDLLSFRPDFVVIEFSVNDDNSLFFRETYEGLVRKVYGADFAPAVLLVHNVFYETGTNAQDQHETIGRYYGLPCVSMKTSIYQAVAAGRIPVRDITPDDLHPNDAGHRLLADLIICFLEQVQEEAKVMQPVPPAQASGGVCEAGQEILPLPITENAYEHSVRYQTYNSMPKLSGFVADTKEQHGITDIFKHGFIGKKAGDSISFDIEGTGVAVQYRKSVSHPACVAKAVLDGDMEHAAVLDGNFDETWGDCLYITTLGRHMEWGVHHLEITITEGDETMVPFYLVSVIGS